MEVVSSRTKTCKHVIVIAEKSRKLTIRGMVQVIKFGASVIKLTSNCAPISMRKEGNNKKKSSKIEQV